MNKLNLSTFTNLNEITKIDFDNLVKSEGLEVYTQQAIAKYIEDVAALIEKGEEGGELTSEDKSAIEIAKAEISNLKKIVVVDNVEGNLVKSTLFIQDQMIDIEKAVYKDNAVNRKLGRVGRSYKEKKADEADASHKVGDKVKVPHNLTTDPANKQGHSGEVHQVNKDHVVVKFDDGKTGKYDHDAIEKVKSEKKDLSDSDKKNIEGFVNAKMNNKETNEKFSDSLDSIEKKYGKEGYKYATEFASKNLKDNKSSESKSEDKKDDLSNKKDKATKVLAIKVEYANTEGTDKDKKNIKEALEKIKNAKSREDIADVLEDYDVEYHIIEKILGKN